MPDLAKHCVHLCSTCFHVKSACRCQLLQSMWDITYNLNSQEQTDTTFRLRHHWILCCIGLDKYFHSSPRNSLLSLWMSVESDNKISAHISLFYLLTRLITFFTYLLCCLSIYIWLNPTFLVFSIVSISLFIYSDVSHSFCLSNSLLSGWDNWSFTHEIFRRNSSLLRW